MANRTTNSRRVAPHHLGEVAPRIVKVRVVVGVLGLFLMPAVGSGARELDPRVVGAGGRADGGEVAAGAFLRLSVNINHHKLAYISLNHGLCTGRVVEGTHVNGPILALLDVGASSIGKLGVPAEVLGAVKATPVPVGAHHGRDEVGVVLVGSGVVDESARLDIVRGRCNGGGGHEGDKGGDELHVVFKYRARICIGTRVEVSSRGRR